MATGMSYAVLTKEGYEYRSELLVNKVFNREGKSNHFVCIDNSIFVAEYIKINGTRVDKGDTLEIAGKILALKLLPNAQRKVELVGKYQGEKGSSTISVGKLQKSEEFGGQPAGGKKVNKGIQFENDLNEVITEQLAGIKSKKTYTDQVEKIIDRCCKSVGSPVVKIIPEGAQNKSRPIKIQNGTMFIAPLDHKQHGALLTDTTLLHKNGKKSYLSLKFSSTLTFVNAGIGKILTATDIKSGVISNKDGLAILTTLGIDPIEFCRVFNEYGKTKFNSVKANINKTKLKQFLQTCIGSNYWMVHGIEGGKIYFWEMTPEKNPQFATISGDVEIQYGGSTGRGKRIDIVFSNTYFDFKINIRNKQGGLYPTHIMCDYKSKPATGKELL